MIHVAMRFQCKTLKYLKVTHLNTRSHSIMIEVYMGAARSELKSMGPSFGDLNAP